MKLPIESTIQETLNKLFVNEITLEDAKYDMRALVVSVIEKLATIVYHETDGNLDLLRSIGIGRIEKK
jgi:hypothetical protein